MGLFSGSFYSENLKMNTYLRIIFPDESNDVTPAVIGEPSLLYLLHGLSGNSEEWIRFSKLEYYAKKYNLIMILPEVSRSFYCDYPGGQRFFTYVADELPELAASWLKLPKERSKTFIAGESMGGYGAVKIGLRRQERFGAIASLSGVLDYASLCRSVMSGTWTDMNAGELIALHGPSGIPGPEDLPLHLVREAASCPDRPRLIQLCGTEDFLYENNQTFRRAAESAGYGHTYVEGPGEHAWPYWDIAIQQAIRFFLNLEPLSNPIY
ncbi:MAG: esterase family protein [Clostridia bacterium]|nr:esterase family protein [Clostridia bacterium]MBQ6475788.1 esterase family protein [Clostridia bacterium]MBR0445568.1 esterase family protein [Clostridia bacterium]MCR5073952.1 esterase family protein [Clostridiales bacterium]